MGGKCVRLRQGRFEESTVFADNPTAVARQWVEQGAQIIHIVDLDGARTGSPQVLGLLPEITQAGVPLELGGGMRAMESIRAALEAGATRVSPGSRMATDREFASEVIGEFGERIAVDIAAKDGMVAIHGWQDVTERHATELAKEMEQLGASRIVFTDVTRDGMLEGPNYESLAEMVAAVEIPIVASGGITRLDDVRRLAGTGVEACIIGRALYSGDIKLMEAIATADK
jgi:phosphoribosylformimino-5-aminoimidazole carboxamide ribotide isomerase